MKKITYICDGCGKEEVKGKIKFDIRFDPSMERVLDKAELEYSGEFDLCDKCSRDFLDWIQTKQISEGIKKVKYNANI